MAESFSDRNIRIEKSAVGSAIVSGDGNTIYVIHQGIEPQDEPTSEDENDADIGPNPYKGLAAFQAKDAANYFGRETQVERLWQRFQDLYEQSGRPESKPRFLPILGPSGCGKSSLARAGLVPELARRPLPGKEKMRVVVMVPGVSPLKSLAGVLAKLTQDDKTPEVIKKRSYEEELRKSAASRRFDFWQDVAETLLDVQSVPIVVLVDQFEEIYSLCEDAAEREAFIENLLYAACSATGYVSVVVTLRSDFLGETQRHKVLNQLIGSDLSMIVPAMEEAELRRAIALPAQQAGHPLDESTVDLLVNDAEGREGALPLLQFALTRIWEGLKDGKSPAETYREMNGVGGALAQKAQDIYDSLNANEQEIARRVFLGLVQLGEGVRDTRRRAVVENLATSRDTSDRVKQVVGRFSAPGARLISLSSEANKEMAEVTHEALFEHWALLNHWLDNSRDDLRFQRRLEEDAVYWDEQGRPDGLLWRSPDLDLLRKFESSASEDLSLQSAQFFTASDRAEKREKKQKRRLLTGLMTSLFATTALSLFSGYKVHQASRRQMELYEARAQDLADSNELESMVNALAAIGLGRSLFVKLPNPFRAPMVSSALLDKPNRAVSASAIIHTEFPIRKLAISANGETIAGFDSDGILRVWDRNGNPIQADTPYQTQSAQHPILKISSDGQTIALQETTCPGNIHLLDRRSNRMTNMLEIDVGSTDQDSCRRGLFSMSGDGRIVVGSNGRRISIWQINGEDVSQRFIENPSTLASLSISQDGQTIVGSSLDRKIRLWDTVGKSVSQPFSTESFGKVAISGDTQTIASANSSHSIQLWDRQGNPIGNPLVGHVRPIETLMLDENGQTITATTLDNSTKVWKREGEIIVERDDLSLAMTPDMKTVVSLAELYNGSFSTQSLMLIQHDEFDSVPRLIEGESGQIFSIDIGGDPKTLATAGLDGLVRLFNQKGEKIHEFPLAAVGGFSTFDLSEDGETILYAIDSSTANRQEATAYPPQTLLAQNRQGEIRRLLGQKTLPFTDPVISADQETIVGISEDGKVYILNDEGENIVPPVSLGEDVTFGSVEDISADGSTFVVMMFTTEKDFIQVVSREGVLLSERLNFDTNQPFLVTAASVDGKTIAVVETSTDGGVLTTGQSIVLFGLKGKRLESFPIDGPRAISALAVSSDGSFIATGDMEGVIRLWDRKGRAMGEPLEGHTGVIRELMISTDGKMIVSSSEDDTARLWPVSQLSAGWVSYTCDRLANYLPERSKTSDVAKDAKRTCDRYENN